MAQAKKKRLSKKAVPRQITELENAIAEVRSTRKNSPRTARLIASGLPRMAQKVAEEATEVVIEAIRGRRTAVIHESVDLIYKPSCLVERARDCCFRGLGRNGSPARAPSS
jgi:phosphoribosyl-ATP pyrophosphohydrolase